jgi:hypothetical protein
MSGTLVLVASLAAAPAAAGTLWLVDDRFAPIPVTTKGGP